MNSTLYIQQCKQCQKYWSAYAGNSLWCPYCGSRDRTFIAKVDGAEIIQRMLNGEDVWKELTGEPRGIFKVVSEGQTTTFRSGSDEAAAKQIAGLHSSLADRDKRIAELESLIKGRKVSDMKDPYENEPIHSVCDSCLDSGEDNCTPECPKCVKLPYPLVEDIMPLTEFEYPQPLNDKELERQQAANQAARDAAMEAKGEPEYPHAGGA